MDAELCGCGLLGSNVRDDAEQIVTRCGPVIPVLFSLEPFSHTFLHSITRDGSIYAGEAIPADDHADVLTIAEAGTRTAPGTDGGIYQEERMSQTLSRRG